MGFLALGIVPDDVWADAASCPLGSERRPRRAASAAPRAGLKEELMSALLVGYARVSTHAQDLTAQRDALAA